MAGIGDQEERGVVHSGDIDEGTHFQFPFQHLPWPASEHQNKDHDDCISDWSGTLFYAAASLLSPVTTRCVRIFPTSTTGIQNGFTTNTRIRGFDLRRSTVSWIMRLETQLTATHIFMEIIFPLSTRPTTVSMFTAGFAPIHDKGDGSRVEYILQVMPYHYNVPS